MAWIFLEGLDRSGKTTLAKLYEKQGFRMVHMSAPSKKYTEPGYAGPSYLDEMLDIYMKNNAGDCVFDRSPYGECIWPLVYGRKAQLSEEDLEVLKEIEENNQAEYYLMYDSNVEAHWKRCVENKEPLTRNQFNQANLFYDRMATRYDFKKLQLPEALNGANADFIAPVMTDEEKARLEKSLKNTKTITNQTGNATSVINVEVTGSIPEHVVIGGGVDSTPLKATKTAEQMKLEKGNAINDVLSKRILKQKGPLFDEIENDIRTHLNTKLGTILGNAPAVNAGQFSKEETEVLKLYVKQLKKKMETK